MMTVPHHDHHHHVHRSRSSNYSFKKYNNKIVIILFCFLGCVSQQWTMISARKQQQRQEPTTPRMIHYYRGGDMKQQQQQQPRSFTTQLKKFSSPPAWMTNKKKKILPTTTTKELESESEAVTETKLQSSTTRSSSSSIILPPAIVMIGKQILLLVTFQLTNWKEIAITIGGIIATVLSLSILLANSSTTIIQQEDLSLVISQFTYWIIVVVSGITFLTAPLSILWYHEISTLQGFRTILNELRTQINDVSIQNQQLKINNSQLQQGTKRLQKAQKALEQTSQDHGISLDVLVDKVNEYQQIQEAIQIDLKSKIQQTLVSTMLRGDKDENLIIDPNTMEFQRLVVRLENINGITFDREQLRHALMKQCNGDILEFSNRYLSTKALVSSSSEKKKQKDSIFQFT